MFSRLFKQLARLSWMLPGFLLYAAYPPMGERGDVLFALSPLIYYCRTRSSRAAMRFAFLTGLFFFLATLSWMPAIVKNGGPWPLVVLGWLGLSAYSALYFAAFGGLSAATWGWVGSSYPRRLLAILVMEPVLWCGLELVRSRLFGGFAWNQLGVPLANAGFGASAALGGVYLISALVILANGIVASLAERIIAPFIWRSRKVVSPWKRSLETIVITMVILLVFGFSMRYSSKLNVNGERCKLTVAMLQRNFPCAFKPNVESPSVVYQRLGTAVSYVKPDLLVLSESAFSEVDLVDSARSAAFAGRLLELSGANALIAGGSREDANGIYNSAAVFEKGRGLTAIYDKVHLVPFGEYIPGDKLFPWLQHLAPVGSCTAGKLKTVLAAGVECGVAICFEDTDSAQIRQLANAGAQLLVFITNDSWFSASDEALQHAWQARLRAIETGLTIVRCGNSGVTEVVRPNGSTETLIDGEGKPLVDRMGTMAASVETRKGAKTLYVRLGDKLLMSVFVLCLLAMILVKYKAYYEKRRLLPV